MERAELISFVRKLGCADERGAFVFLRDPHWSPSDLAAADLLMQRAATLPAPEFGWLCIRTGGSGGGVKFARHDERTLGAAIEGFCRHFELSRADAVGVLPPWHVSGLMARLRCFATGGEYIACEWKSLESGQRPVLPASGNWALSLVPTQLQRLIGSPDALQWLRGFRQIFLGGGPVWPELADAAATAKLPVSLSYGMTETAAMITAQRPSEFLAGDRSAGSVLPHGNVTLTAEGRVVISGASLFSGYFPDLRTEPEFVTQDLGRIDGAGRLHLLGRADAVIITGGKKVQPAEVEAALRASGEFDDVAVVGEPDLEWGEVVVACYPSSAKHPDLPRAMAGLASYQRPKRFVPIAEWPRNAQGKINRAALLAAVRSAG